LDILGQKNDLLKYGYITSGDIKLEKKVFKQIKIAHSNVQKVRKLFEDNLPIAFGRSPIYGSQPQDYKDIIDKVREQQVGQMVFSDTVVFFIPLDMQSKANVSINIYTMFYVLSIVMFTCSIYGIPIRGGIDIGPCIKMSNTEIYGAGLAKAHILESQCADYQRVLVGDETREFIKKVNSIEPEDIEQIIAKNFAAKSLEFLLEDNDKFWALDYCGAHVRSLLKSTSDSSKVSEMFKNYVEKVNEQKNILSKKGNLKVAKKLGRLLSYLETRKEIWS
jgi:hypothetical protein